MGIIVRQGLKSTIIAFLGVVIGAINTMWIFPKYLSVQEFGLTRLVQEIGLFVAAFTQIGAANIIDRFFPLIKKEYGDGMSKTINGFLLFILLYPLIGFVVFCTGYMLFKDFWLGIYQEKSPMVNQYFYLFIPLVFFCTYQLVLEAYSRAFLRIVVPSIFKDIVLKLGTLGLVIAYSLSLITFHQLIISLVVGYGVTILLILAYLQNLGVLDLKPNFKFLNKKLLMEMGTYGAFIILGGAGAQIVSRIDTLMIAAMVGDKLLGIYILSYFIGTVIEMPRRSISQISTPIISQAWAANDIAKIEELYQKTAINQLMIGAFLFLGIWCNVDAIFNLIPNSEVYRPGKYIILFIGLARLFDMATGVNGEIILQSRYYRFNLISIALLAALCVVTNLVFIPIYGITGAAFATALSVFLYNILKFVFLWVKYRIQPFSIKTIYTLLIIGFVFFTAMLIPPPKDQVIDSLINILLRSTLITVLFTSAMYLLRISEDANALLATFYEKAKTLINK